MSDICIRTDGKAGRITLTRPDALNALTYPMCSAIEDALDNWNRTDSVDVIVIDADGSRAFCAGGDIVEMHRSALAGNLSYGRKFWRDEYRLNAKIANSRLPVVTFMQGFTMGGGVGIGCHASYRIVGHSSLIAMPECTIGLIPDVGGSGLLAKAPGRTGECMAVAGIRANATAAIWAGLADIFMPEETWPDAVNALARSGDTAELTTYSSLPPAVADPLADEKQMIDRVFALASMPEVSEALKEANTEFASKCLKATTRNSPLSMACALKLIRMQRRSPTIEKVLGLEYRFVHRSVEHTDFVEGIRALVIDKDNNPKWRHSCLEDVGSDEVDALLAPLGAEELELEILQ